MQEILIHKLHQYIRENNPELLIQLEEENALAAYLNEKTSHIISMRMQAGNVHPAYISEEACMEVLTEDLRPSKFNYMKEILQEEFENYYEQCSIAGILQFEVINLIRECKSVFDHLGFTIETEDSNDLRNAITGVIAGYLESNSEDKTVKSELQQTTKIIR